MKASDFFIKKEERKFLFIVISIFLLITNIPYLYGWFQSDAKYHFSGFLINLEDQYQYLSLIKQAKEGKFFFSFLYTPEIIPARVIQPLFFLMGLLSHILPTLLVYHLFRNIFIVLFIIILSVFIRSFIRENLYQRWTLFFILFTGGWSLLELLVHDANTFLMLFLYPHITAALILMLVIFSMILSYSESTDKKKLFYAAGFTFLLGLIHLYDVITIYAVSALFFLWKFIATRDFKQYFFNPILFYILSIPPMIYQAWVVMYHPSYRIIASFIYPQVNFFSLLFTVGIFSFLSLLFFWKWTRKTLDSTPYTDRQKFLALWIFVVTLLITSIPFPNSRRLVLGLQIPFLILGSSILFEYVVPKIAYFLKKRASEIVFFFGTFIFILHIWTPTGVFLSSLTSLSKHSLYFYPTIYYEDLRDIEKLAPKGTVLASYIAGRLIPHTLGNRVFQGHWMNTLFVYQKFLDYDRFFSEETSNDYRKEFLQKYPISYILVVEDERKKIESFQIPNIKKIFSGRISDLYVVFK